MDAVYRALDARVAARLQQDPDIDAVYAYEDGAWASFRSARELGVKAIYELPIGYWRFSRKLLEEEAVREPEWATTLRGNHDSTEKLSRKDEELALADHILVPSEFVRKTLSGVAGVNRSDQRDSLRRTFTATTKRASKYYGRQTQADIRGRPEPA